MDKKLVFVTRHYKKGWLSIDFFLFDIHRFILININRINSQKSWKPILRTFMLQALCAHKLGAHFPTQPAAQDSLSVSQNGFLGGPLSSWRGGRTGQTNRDTCRVCRPTQTAIVLSSPVFLGSRCSSPSFVRSSGL